VFACRLSTLGREVASTIASEFMVWSRIFQGFGPQAEAKATIDRDVGQGSYLAARGPNIYIYIYILVVRSGTGQPTIG
jgi:uncharacterized ferredoxin-like protein